MVYRYNDGKMDILKTF